MAVPFIQASFTTGENDPKLRTRADVKAFYTGLRRALNVVARPQSGFQLRGGLRHVSRLRRDLAYVPLQTAMLSSQLAVTAGSFDNALSAALPPLTLAAAPGPSVILDINLGLTRHVAAVDLLGFSAPAGGVDWLIFEHSLDGVTWTEWGRRDLRPSLNSRRVAFPPGATRPMRRIRVRSAGATGALTIGFVAVLEQGAAKGAVRLFRHQVGAEPWIIAVTPANMDLFKGREWKAALPSPYTAQQIETLSLAHDAGGVIVFHPDVQPQLVQRRVSDDEWHIQSFPFNNIPTRNFDDTGLNEAIMSATRGWPACGCFWNQRLVIGGLRSLPQTLLLSAQGNPNGFDITASLATDAMSFDLSGDEQGIPQIRRLRAGPRLEVYTQMAFFYSAEQVAAKGSGFGFVLSERTPIREATRVIEASNYAYLIEDGGATLRRLSWDEKQIERYTTAEISVFNAHLVEGARDLACRPARSSQGFTLMAVSRDDRSWFMGWLLPTQELVGFAPQDAGGPVLAVAAVGTAQDIVLAVDRGADVHLEWLDDAARLDMSVLAPTGAAIAGLDHLTGRQDVFVRSDEAIIGPVAVQDGVLQAGLQPGAMCEVGVPFAWEAEQLRLAGDAQRQIAFNRTIHCSVVRLELDRASVFDMTVDDGEWRTVELPPRPDALDPTLAQRDFRGTVEEDGFLGSGDGSVRLRGSSLHPFELVSILREASW